MAKFISNAAPCSGQMLKIPALPWLLGLLLILQMVIVPPALAARVDEYVYRFLAKEPVAIPINSAGETQLFSPEQLTVGKQLFDQNCKNCHVGGATLPNPAESLALADLRAAHPPRDNVAALVAYQRSPMLQDGSELSYLCRRVSQDWLTTDQLQDLAAFLLRAAEKSPGWGTDALELSF